MKIRTFIISIVTIVAVTIGLLHYFNLSGSEDHNQTIIELERENLRLEHENAELDSLILKRQRTNDSLQDQINENQQIIQNLHYEIKEKINAIDRMSNMELYLYFSNISTDQKNHRE